MKVLLRTNLIIDGIRYRPSLEGTEIPDHTRDGRKIVLHDPKSKRPRPQRNDDGEVVKEPEVYMLPKGIVAFSNEAAKEREKQNLPLNAKAQKPAETFSEMTRGAKLEQKRANVDL